MPKESPDKEAIDMLRSALRYQPRLQWFFTVEEWKMEAAKRLEALGYLGPLDTHGAVPIRHILPKAKELLG